MAKSTSTTKAKSKTTKKPAAKTASAKTTKTTAKTRATKTTSKAKVTKKTTAVKATKPAAKAEVKRAVVTTTGVNKPFVVVGAAFALLAVFAGFFMKTASAAVFLGHLTKDELASNASTVLVSAAHPLYEVEFRWLLVVLLGVSAVFAIVRGTKWQAREIAGIKAGVQPTRWLDVAVTGALMC